MHIKPITKSNIEPCHVMKKKNSPRFQTRSNTIWAGQSQKMAKGFKFQIWEVEESYNLFDIAICAFVLTYLKGRISHDAAQMVGTSADRVS